MPPRKKVKIRNDKDVKIKNVSKKRENEFSVPNIQIYSNRLSLLPVDVLLYIYQFLSTADLLSISQLGDRKLTEVVDVQREVNFSICRRTSFQLVSSYFNQERVKYIQKLNFSFYIFAKPCDLVKIICRCKNLIKLSIIECGIQYRQFLKILHNCPALKDVSWNIKDISEQEVFFHSSVTKLFLILDVPRHMVTTAYKILKNFPKLECVVTCFIPDTLIEPPFITTWSESLSFTSNDNLRWFTVIKNLLRERNGSIVLELVAMSEQFYAPPERDEDLDNFPNPFNACYNHPPFLKIKTEDLNISSLSLCTSSCYSSVIIVMTSKDIDVYERLFKCISKVAGCKLKHLTIECENYVNGRLPQLPPLEIDRKMTDIFGIVFLDCKNITVLNFGKIHFSSHSPLKSMCSLKNLKILNMPTCAFPELHGSNSRHDQSSYFEEFVSSCWKVEDFHLYCCNKNLGKMQDSELFAVQNWKRLISFTIYFVIFRTCRFLRKIADFCPDLQSFSLIETSSSSRSIFYGDVIYLLRNAKKLSFIRISEKHFNPLFGQFMDAISLAKNLEGICFMTELNTYFNAVSFKNSIDSLKYLHLFHFHAPCVSNNLYIEVRKSMERNGIKNVKIENDCLENDNFRFQGTTCFHMKPHFHCKYLHFKKVLSDTFTYFEID